MLRTYRKKVGNKQKRHIFNEFHMFPLQLSLPDWRCQGCQRRGFCSPHVSPQSQSTNLSHLSPCQLSLTRIFPWGF
uniref:Uncharacterized protein n=1 Tax=Geospiza parvula TaxID=87175 RepID=A0A8C3NE66_GEOPR